MSARLADLVPGGCHTYSKGADRFPRSAPPVLVKGKGGLVWDAGGRSYVDWGMGINNVLIGHAEDGIDDAAVAALRNGQAFFRPRELEEAAAEAVVEVFPQAQMVKFCKNGSDANNAAIRLARAVTGRQHIAYDGTAPFFSTADWFCSAMPKWAGTLDAERAFALPFVFNDIDSVVRCFEQRPLAAVILEVCRTVKPTRAFLDTLVAECQAHGTLLVLDEVVTGYRYGQQGAAPLFGLQPDLFALGKGLANGYSAAALCGKREYMSAGVRDVFLLSTTNGAERSGLAAVIATAQFYQQHRVTWQLAQTGQALCRIVDEEARRAGVRIVVATEFGCRPAFLFGSEAEKARFYEVVTANGVLIPPAWACPCFRRTEAELDLTRDAVRAGCQALASREVRA